MSSRSSQVLQDRFAGVVRLGAPGLAGEFLKSRFDLGGQAYGKHCEPLIGADAIQVYLSSVPRFNLHRPGDDPDPPAGAGEEAQAAASIKILNGANEGRELQLVKALTTIGRPGHQVAVITRRPTGYFIAHVEGEVFPTVNGTNLGSAAHPLKHKDVIELAGVRMEFVNAPAGLA